MASTGWTAGMKSIESRLAKNDVLLIDGGIGTEIERRGVRMDTDAWCGVANKTYPDVIRRVHEDYIRAGAEVITANTFATARHVLEAAGLADEVQVLNNTAVNLAREARDSVAEHPVWIAGSMSSTPAFRESGLPDDQQAASNYREQAGLLAEAGVDLIIAEMMSHTKNASLVVNAALETGLPVWAGFSAEVNRESGEVLPWGVTRSKTPPGDLGEAIETVMGLGDVRIMGIMHTKLSDFDAALSYLRQRWPGPTMAYAESGLWESPSWRFVGVVSPEDYAQAALRWVTAGVCIVGGCCGIGPEHIRELRRHLQ